MAVKASGEQIRIPQGDTGSVKFVIEKNEVITSDKGVFTVVNNAGGPILRKILTPNFEDMAFHLPFVYEDTAMLKPGSYAWSFRIVRDGVFDTAGRLTDARISHTPILQGRLIIQPVAGGAR